MRLNPRYGVNMGKAKKNILFIMYDQLRWDYLGCAGHPHLDTPNFDWLASQGVRFNQAFAQSAVCGASRMSTYTGRYVSSHGAAWNGFPLKVGELTIGDHLRKLGMDAVLLGKTHMRADVEGMERLGVDPDSVIGVRVAECGFDPYIRDEGMEVVGPDGRYSDIRSPYNDYLWSIGYESLNPWHDHANSAVDDSLNVMSGFAMKNSALPANIIEKDSETPWLTSEMINWLEKRKPDDPPWCVHLSFIKPHWPYIAPRPYNSMYNGQDIIPPVATEEERRNSHPVYRQYQDGVIAEGWSKEEVRERAIPAYMGLIKQCDDQLGRLLDYLRKSDRLQNTMIILTSDHGDNLGDHHLGEKDMMHDSSIRVPLIVYDPSPDADKTRGLVCDALVEGIDLAATFVEFHGGEIALKNLDHILEGRSLMPWLKGQKPSWREFAVSEYDYSMTPYRAQLGVSVKDARWTVLVDHRWKFTHFEGGFRPMLFDRINDPEETIDLAEGSTPEIIDALELMYRRLASFRARVCQRTTLSSDEIISKTGASRRRGVVLGMYDEGEAPELLDAYGKAVKKNYTQ